MNDELWNKCQFDLSRDDILFIHFPYFSSCNVARERIKKRHDIKWKWVRGMISG